MGEHQAASNQVGATTSAEMCPLGLADCDMRADGVDLHYRPGEAPEPCFICKDPLNHFGHDHGRVTGDGRTRADVEATPSTELPREIDGVDWESAAIALTMLTCPWRNRIGICHAGCRDEPECETCEPEGGWAQQLREAVKGD